MGKRWGIFIVVLAVIAISVGGGMTAANYVDQETSSNNIVRGSKNWATPAWPAPAADWYSGPWATPTPTPTWYYRKPVTITNSGAALTNYLLEMTGVPFVNGHMNADFSDLRFTDGSGNLLDFWIESYASSTSADIWVKIPSVPAGTSTIYMYYGNWAASTSTGSASVLAAHYLDLHDFEDIWSENPLGWSEINGNRGELQRMSTGGQNGSYSLYINNTSQNSQIYGGSCAFAFPSAPFFVAFLVKPEQADQTFEMCLARNSTGNNNTLGPRLSLNSNGYIRFFTSGNWNDFVPSFRYYANTMYDIKLYVNQSSYTYQLFVNGVQQYAQGGAANIPFANDVSLTFYNYFFAATSATPKAYLDHMRVWLAVDVSYSLGEEQ